MFKVVVNVHCSFTTNKGGGGKTCLSEIRLLKLYADQVCRTTFLKCSLSSITKRIPEGGEGNLTAQRTSGCWDRNVPAVIMKFWWPLAWTSVFLAGL